MAVKLSIIIPTYNEEKTLPFLLSSTRQQGFIDYEVIVADANSTDRTRKIARDFGCLVVTGGMPAVGRNRGAAAARGEYLFFVDADVIIPRGFIKNVFAEMKEKDIQIASCGVVPLSNKNIDVVLHGLVNAYLNATQYFYPHAPGFCIIIKRSIHEQVGGFDEKLTLAEDHDYVKRAKKLGKFRILKKVKILVSVRRLDSDGRINVSAKYVLVEVYRLLVGEIETDIFKYKFGHHKKQWLSVKPPKFFGGMFISSVCWKKSFYFS